MPAWRTAADAAAPASCHHRTDRDAPSDAPGAPGARSA
jgi:hypothetical protein